MRCMHAIFGRFDCGPPMLDHFVQVFCNDILIFSNTCEVHLEHVLTVLATLLHHKLYDKASKFQFCSSSVCFLGYVIFE